MKQNQVIKILKNLIEALEIMDSKLFEPRYENQIIALTEAIRCVEENEQLKEVLREKPQEVATNETE